MATGDHQALALLYDRYGASMHAFANRILRNAADAEEAVMAAFMQAWRQAGRFAATKGSVAAWLTMITRSRSLDIARARARRARYTESAGENHPTRAPAMGREMPNPGAAYDRQEVRKQVAEAVHALLEPEQQAIHLALYEGLTHSQIAERLNQPLGTIKSRLRSGMSKLRESLRPVYEEFMP